MPPDGYFGYAFRIDGDKITVKSWIQHGNGDNSINREMLLDEIKYQVLEGYPHPKLGDYLKEAGFEIDPGSKKIYELIREILEEKE